MRNTITILLLLATTLCYGQGEYKHRVIQVSQSYSYEDTSRDDNVRNHKYDYSKFTISIDTEVIYHLDNNWKILLKETNSDTTYYYYANDLIKNVESHDWSGSRTYLSYNYNSQKQLIDLEYKVHKRDDSGYWAADLFVSLKERYTWEPVKRMHILYFEDRRTKIFGDIELMAIESYDILSQYLPNIFDEEPSIIFYKCPKFLSADAEMNKHYNINGSISQEIYSGTNSCSKPLISDYTYFDNGYCKKTYVLNDTARDGVRIDSFIFNDKRQLSQLVYKENIYDVGFEPTYPHYENNVFEYADDRLTKISYYNKYHYIDFVRTYTYE